jgi:amino acid transporter
MTELTLIAVAFFALEVLLLVINYIVFSKYPKKKEIALGGDILERKGVAWFVIYKFGLFTVYFIVLMVITPFLPIRYSYLILGVLLGIVCFNVVHDYLEYRAEGEKSKKLRWTKA